MSAGLFLLVNNSHFSGGPDKACRWGWDYIPNLHQKWRGAKSIVDDLAPMRGVREHLPYRVTLYYYQCLGPTSQQAQYIHPMLE